MKKGLIKASQLAVIFFLLWVGLKANFQLTSTVYAQAESGNETSQTIEGEVTKILASGRESFNDELIPFQELQIQVNKGPNQGETIELKNSAAGFGLVDVRYQEYQVGDRLRISYQPQVEGAGRYAIEGQIKRKALFNLTLLFLLVVLIVGRKWGALSIFGLIISFLVIFKIVIPLIISGRDPILAAALGSTIIIPSTFYVSHGFNRKTHVAVIVTLVALLITGWLATYFVNAAHLTGFASEEAGFLQVQRQGTIDIRGLLLAGIIIGALGILDDITLGQASTVKQLAKVNPEMNFKDLFIRGMQVGQDHISSMVNTLVLVYAGSALPLLLLFFDSQKTFIDLLEFELIAEEIIRMLVGSIGLVLAAPLATALAAYLFQKDSSAQLAEK